jgi:hypothetical protein
MQARGRGPSLTVFSVSVIVNALDRVLALDGAFRDPPELGRKSCSSVSRLGGSPLCVGLVINQKYLSIRQQLLSLV